MALQESIFYKEMLYVHIRMLELGEKILWKGVEDACQGEIPKKVWEARERFSYVLDSLLELKLGLERLTDEAFRKEWHEKGRQEEFMEKYNHFLNGLLLIDHRAKKHCKQYESLSDQIHEALKY